MNSTPVAGLTSNVLLGMAGSMARVGAAYFILDRSGIDITIKALVLMLLADVAVDIALKRAPSTFPDTLKGKSFPQVPC
jgi:hypothetical protein